MDYLLLSGLQSLQPHIINFTYFSVVTVQGKYKVYNLCSERLYDASLFGGKVGQRTLLVVVLPAS